MIYDFIEIEFPNKKTCILEKTFREKWQIENGKSQITNHKIVNRKLKSCKPQIAISKLQIVKL
jgi:hypothetical protein